MDSGRISFPVFAQISRAIYGPTAPIVSLCARYPPADANDFAQKYIMGKFTYVSNIDKIKQRVAEKAGESVFEGLGDLPSIDEVVTFPFSLTLPRCMQPCMQPCGRCSNMRRVL